jgi:hypothetical protein
VKYFWPARNNTVAMRNRKICLAILIILALMPALFLLLAHIKLRRFEGLRPGDWLPQARVLSQSRLWLETVSWRGTHTLLVVVTPGCPLCQREIESLASIAPTFPDLRIVLLSTRNDITGLQVPFPVYTDPDGAFLRKVRRLFTPAIYLVDPAGQVRYARIGQQDAREEKALFMQLLEPTHDSAPEPSRQFGFGNSRIMPMERHE